MLSFISDEMKKKIIEMDNKTFPTYDWGTLEEAETLYSIKNDSIILLLKDDTPIGFVSIFAFNRIYLELFIFCKWGEAYAVCFCSRSWARLVKLG
jgi:hypothetical protein